MSEQVQRTSAACGAPFVVMGNGFTWYGINEASTRDRLARDFGKGAFVYRLWSDTQDEITNLRSQLLAAQERLADLGVVIDVDLGPSPGDGARRETTQP